MFGARVGLALSGGDPQVSASSVEDDRDFLRRVTNGDDSYVLSVFIIF